MRVNSAAVVIIFGMMLASGVVLVSLERDDLAAALFTSAISLVTGFLLGGQGQQRQTGKG
jgi:xanthine/uracil permease